MSEEEFGTRRMPAPAGPDEPEPAPPADPGRSGDEGSAAAPMLVVARGPQSGRQIALNRSPVELGRSATCDIVLDDVTVSRQHAKISRQAGGHVVTDLGSLNGTYVNRSPVDQAVALNDGDELRIGIFRMIFRT